MAKCVKLFSCAIFQPMSRSTHRFSPTLLAALVCQCNEYSFLARRLNPLPKSRIRTKCLSLVGSVIHVFGNVMLIQSYFHLGKGAVVLTALSSAALSHPVVTKSRGDVFGDLGAVSARTQVCHPLHSHREASLWCGLHPVSSALTLVQPGQARCDGCHAGRNFSS